MFSSPHEHSQAKTKLLEGFLKRTEEKGKVVPWVPQLALLAHPSVGVFVTHGGWSSILESIITGVPMICRPFFADQMFNKRFIETVWQIGTGVEGEIFTKSGTLDALKKSEVVANRSSCGDEDSDKKLGTHGGVAVAAEQQRHSADRERVGLWVVWMCRKERGQVRRGAGGGWMSAGQYAGGAGCRGAATVGI
ncbi:hypothetical protein Ancab_028456 [Ancistrocladus abbreviatus]